MLSLLVSGRLVRDPQQRTTRTGKPYTTALVVVPVETRSEDEPDRVLVNAIALGKVSAGSPGQR